MNQKQGQVQRQGQTPSTEKPETARVPIQVWVTEEEKRFVEQEARKDNRSVSNWLATHVVRPLLEAGCQTPASEERGA